MGYIIHLSEEFNRYLSIKEHGKNVIIKILSNSKSDGVEITQKELYNFIGTLLHVHAKMKEGKNG